MFHLEHLGMVAVANEALGALAIDKELQTCGENMVDAELLLNSSHRFVNHLRGERLGIISSIKNSKPKHILPNHDLMNASLVP